MQVVLRALGFPEVAAQCVFGGPNTDIDGEWLQSQGRRCMQLVRHVQVCQVLVAKSDEVWLDSDMLSKEQNHAHMPKLKASH